MSDAAIRTATPTDADALAALYAASFPDEDLVPLVRALLVRADVASLVAIGGTGEATGEGDPIGHVALTACRVVEAPDEGLPRDGPREETSSADGTVPPVGTPVALLGPLAVAPAHQRAGVGGTLLRAGLERVRADGAAAVVLLGDPAYYGRHGFRAERRIAPPYALPAEWRDAWQSLALADGPAPGGVLRVPKPWARRELWAP